MLLFILFFVGLCCIAAGVKLCGDLEIFDRNDCFFGVAYILAVLITFVVGVLLITVAHMSFMDMFK